MTDYRQLAVEEAIAQGVDPHLVLRQMRKESGGDPGAVSPKGARGLMQLMPATARQLGVDPSDPVQNIRGGVTYMKQQLDSFGGDPRLAAAAYNAGPGAVRRYGGVPPYAETQDYVRTVAAPSPTAAPDPGYDQDVFGGLGDGDPVAPATPAAGGVPGRRNADGSIDIGDIDRSTNPEFLARQRERLGYDPDVFPEPAAPVGTTPAEPTHRPKTFLGDISDVIGGSIDKLKTDSKAYYEDSTRPKTRKESARQFMTDPLGLKDAMQLGGVVADAAGVALSPIGGLMHAVLRPTSEAIAEHVPIYESGLPALLRGPFARPRRLSKEEGAQALEGDLGVALTSGIPAKGLAGAGLASEAAQAARAGSTAAPQGLDLLGALKRGLGRDRAAEGLADRMNLGRRPPGATPPQAAAAPIAAPAPPPSAPAPGLNLTGKNARVLKILAKALERDGRSYDQVLTDLLARSPHTMPFEIAGENLVGLAEHAGQIPGPGRDFGIERLTQRSATAPDRIKKVADSALGGSDEYFKTRNDLIIRRAEEAKPHFELAFPKPVDADHFERVFRPIVARLPKGAMEKAYDLARQDGRVPEELGLQRGSAVEGRVTRPAPPEEVSAEDLAALRTGKKAPSQGPGLLEFVSKNGGLKDFGGELRAKDLDIWHQKRPFVAKLLRPDGLSDEAMAQKLFEAGYFPEKVAGRMNSADNMTRVTAQDLYDAIDQELAGKPRYARASNDPGRAARLDELERRLREAGVDPRTATPKQASAALGQLRDDIARNEAFAREQGHAPAPGDDDLVHVTNPTLETLHYVKMGLDEALEKFRNPVTGKLELEATAAGRAGQKTRHDLGEALRATDPDYAAAMQVWSERSADLHALKLGRDLFSPKFDMQSEQLADTWAKMSKTSKDHYRKGVGEALVAKVRAGGGVKTMRDVLRSDEFQDRVRLAFKGQKAYEQFIANATREVKMQERFNQVNSGSQTFRRQAQADITGQDGLDAGDLADAGFTAVTGNPGAAIKGVTRKIFKTEAMKTQDVLSDPAANKLLAEALYGDGDTMRLLLQHLKGKPKATPADRYGRLDLARPAVPSGERKERR
ncbi:lytic transglycosylase domain-containing protein [Caulobacter rhizosphaerae]|uniref:lytic transglycosylase domain-containing protein n=1 Tax=Caulobacter rhizosphaerae TaxID=2010972 RepID=UPI0019CDCA81|nr:lytic transglycosylase domain-containing protein [Caulobacter rhizosphaerae]GGL48512.1 hypothetical protein GCM10010983_52320 [Caulobacter rhizosphaerae]